MHYPQQQFSEVSSTENLEGQIENSDGRTVDCYIYTLNGYSIKHPMQVHVIMVDEENDDTRSPHKQGMYVAYARYHDVCRDFLSIPYGALFERKINYTSLLYSTEYHAKH